MTTKRATILAFLTFILGGLIVGTICAHHRNYTYGEEREIKNGKMMNHDSKNMTNMMEDMSMNLQGKTGDQFDKAFLSEMTEHHLGAITMANQVLAKSNRPELIKLAQDIIAAQTKEINQMKMWKDTWFKTATSTQQ